MNNTGKTVILFVLLFGLAAFVTPDRAKEQFQPAVNLVAYPTANAQASPEAKALLKMLYEIKGGYTLSGQHNYLEEPEKHTKRIKALTGKMPALIGYEMGVILDHTDAEVKDFRKKAIDSAIAAYKAGSVVTFTYHAAMPGECECWDKVNNGGISKAQFEEILTPGTQLNKDWLSDIDEVAGYLKKLRDAKVPVLWRPYHEMNGGWFWWGGQAEFPRLWDAMFERYTKVHKLDNLLWVWSPSAPNEYAEPFEPYYVGHLRADVLAVDIYNNEYAQSHHDALQKLGDGKPIAVGEVGELPDPALLSGPQNQYVWFMAWGDELENKNDFKKISSLYKLKRVLTQESVQAWLDKP